MKHLSFVLALCLWSSTLPAQSPQPAKEPLPEGDFLARAPEFSRWVVTTRSTLPFSAPTASSAPKDSETRSVVTKTRGIYFQEFTDTFGRKWQTWVSEKVQATISPDSGAILLGKGGDQQLSTDYSKADFQGLDWISADSFVKTAAYRGRQCLVFSQAPSVPSQSTTATASPADPTPQPCAPTASAVIDFETRLPIYVQRGNKSVTFEFVAPPQATLQIPEEVQNVVQQQAKRAQDLAAKVPRAY